MKVTELEGAALGLVWLQGSTTAYELRKMIAESPTPHWSASAGTVYPLVQKLCRARMISFSSAGETRGTRQLRITSTGKKAFRRWMLDCSPVVIGLPPDPVRTRVRFLGLLSSAEGNTLLEEFEKNMRSQLVRMQHPARGAIGEVSLTDSLTLAGSPPHSGEEGRVDHGCEEAIETLAPTPIGQAEVPMKSPYLVIAGHSLRKR
jgi:DNA-binding PadR family transcriptional regulator